MSDATFLGPPLGSPRASHPSSSSSYPPRPHGAGHGPRGPGSSGARPRRPPRRPAGDRDRGRQPPERARLRGGLDARLRPVLARAPGRRELGARRRGAGRVLRAQGHHRRLLGRELRRRRHGRRGQHPARPAAARAAPVRLRRRHPPDRRRSRRAAVTAPDGRRPPAGHDVAARTAHPRELLLRDGRPVRQRRPGQRRRRARGRPDDHRARPDPQGLLPRRRHPRPLGPAGLHRRPRHHRHLAHPQLQEPSRPGHRRPGERRLPRLLGHRLHPHRPALRHQRRAEGVHRQGPRPRDQGLLRHHHQPHRRRHRLRRGPAGRAAHLHQQGGRAVPRRVRPAVRRPPLRRRRDVPTARRRRVLPLHAGLPQRGRPHGQGAGVAQRPDDVPQPRRLDLRRRVLHLRRLRRPRRPVHRAARRRRRDDRDLQDLGRLRHRRLPHRHRQARQPGVLAGVRAGDP